MACRCSQRQRSMFLLCLAGFAIILFTVHYVCRYSFWSCPEVGGFQVVGRFHAETGTADETITQTVVGGAVTEPVNDYGETAWTVRNPADETVTQTVTSEAVTVGKASVKVTKTAPQSSCNAKSRRYLNDLCKRYQQGEITGSICKSLCDSKEITYLNCFPNGKDKIAVIVAKWGQKKVVLKTSKLSKVVNTALGQFLDMKVDDFNEKITKFIEMAIGIAGNQTITKPILDRIVSECDIGRDGVLLGDEIQQCGRLIQPGLILHTMFKSTKLVPEVYGSCGEMLVHEYLSQNPLRVGIFERKLWPNRVQLALALLDYIQELEHTAYGTLYICDLYWKNLGVVRGSDGRTLIKSIDNDKSYFSGVVERRLNQSRKCRVDHDCHVVACTVECNKATHTCLRKLSSNNLELVCRRMFWINFGYQYAGLLLRPPSWISSDINKLKTQCLKSGKATPHIPQDLIHQFYNVLKRSLMVL